MKNQFAETPEVKGLWSWFICTCDYTFSKIKKATSSGGVIAKSFDSQNKKIKILVDSNLVTLPVNFNCKYINISPTNCIIFLKLIRITVKKWINYSMSNSIYEHNLSNIIKMDQS